MKSIVLSADQYENLYGHKQLYNIQAGLPSFLRRVFTNATVLFIGCSLELDRVTMILGDLSNKGEMADHFAIKKLPGDKKKKIREQRRLLDLGICPIWVKSYEQIEEILVFLAGKPLETPVEVSRQRLGSFVGRENYWENKATPTPRPNSGEKPSRPIKLSAFQPPTMKST